MTSAGLIGSLRNTTPSPAASTGTANNQVLTIPASPRRRSALQSIQASADPHEPTTKGPIGSSAALVTSAPVVHEADAPRRNSTPPTDAADA